MEVKGPVHTDSGMCALWDPVAFRGVGDYDTWDEQLGEDEDIARQVAKGTFVPLNVEGDGAWQVVVRVGDASAPAELTAREQKYVHVVSEPPYLFVAKGDAVVSGIEHVADEPDDDNWVRVPLAEGRWSVAVNLIGWDNEPGQEDEDGNPKPTALPDFVLLVNPEQGGDREYRTNLVSFDRT